jgi:hypothetical protein
MGTGQVRVFALLIAAATTPAALAAQEWSPVQLPGPEEHPAQLIALAQEFRALRGSDDGVPDYAATVRRQKTALPGLRARLEALDPSAWSVHEKIDYLLLRSEMDQLEFDLHVRKPTVSNPSFYVNEAIGQVRAPLTGGRYMGDPELMPFSRERARAVLAALRNTEAVLRQGRQNLTEMVPELADIALRHPGGGYFTAGGELSHIVENYRKWAELTAPHFPEPEARQLVPAAVEAAERLHAFGQWLESERPNMKGTYTLPDEVIDWYHRSVMFLPFTTDELRLMAENERGRVLSYMQFEMHKNRHLPKIEPAKDIEQYLAWDDETALKLRRWYVEKELLSDYDFMPKVESEPGEYILPFGLLAFPYDKKPGVRRILVVPDDHWRAVYSNMGFRTEPGVLHGHEYWPGHSYEGDLRRRLACPIRRGHRDAAHSQGLMNYHEEMPVLLDFPYVRGPRGRELPWINQLQRAERVLLGLDLLAGKITPEEGFTRFRERVPPLGSGLGATREEAIEEMEGVLLRRGLDHGMTGKLQLYRFLGERKMQLKDEFDFKLFNDQLMLHGNVPYSLLRWEVAGLDDEAMEMWEPRRLTDVMASTDRE